jgi:5'-deoxynucleotidase YfbR-like HD superfamily hydrolase
MSIDRPLLGFLYKLESIKRYNTMPTHKEESVASHSYFTALITMMLCEQLDLDRLQTSTAIKLALVHDLPEIVTNDITHDAKTAMPELSVILAKYEERFIKEMFASMHQPMYLPKWDDKIALLVVTLADILSVLQFSDNERMLGNKHISDSWISSVFVRIDELRAELERMGVQCQKIVI